MHYTIYRLPGVLSRSGDSRSQHYLNIQRGLWTSGVKIGARAVGWPAHECDALIAARIAGKSDDDIRTLVAELIDRRKLAAQGDVMDIQSRDDVALEERIAETKTALITSTCRADQLRLVKLHRDLIAQRNPQQVARMESAKGLA